MKYFLCVDKGSYYDLEDRFLKLDLLRLNPKLDCNDNLEYLSNFTMHFANIGELKNYLLSNQILSSILSKYDLCFGYNHDGFKILTIPYICDRNYFSIVNLERVIRKNSQEPGFLQYLIRMYKNYPQLNSVLYEFRRYLNTPYNSLEFDLAVSDFVEKICVRKVKDKKVVNFKALFDLAMLISNLTNSKRESITNIDYVAMPTGFGGKYEKGSPEYYKQVELGIIDESLDEDDGLYR